MKKRRNPALKTPMVINDPPDLFVGLGTRISNTQYDFSLGSPVTTDRELDLMVNGNGFFQVSILPEIGDGIGYSRAGNFFVNRDGEVVSATPMDHAWNHRSPSPLTH